MPQPQQSRKIALHREIKRSKIIFLEQLAPSPQNSLHLSQVGQERVDKHENRSKPQKKQDRRIKYSSFLSSSISSAPFHLLNAKCARNTLLLPRPSMPTEPPPATKTKLTEDSKSTISTFFSSAPGDSVSDSRDRCIKSASLSSSALSGASEDLVSTTKTYIRGRVSSEMRNRSLSSPDKDCITPSCSKQVFPLNVTSYRTDASQKQLGGVTRSHQYNNASGRGRRSMPNNFSHSSSNGSLGSLFSIGKSFAPVQGTETSCRSGIKREGVPKSSNGDNGNGRHYNSNGLWSSTYMVLSSLSPYSNRHFSSGYTSALNQQGSTPFAQPKFMRSPEPSSLPLPCGLHWRRCSDVRHFGHWQQRQVTSIEQ